MVKGTNRAYKVVPVEDEPDFGDPPRNWARVASMTGVWVLLLLGTAWMAPGFASGGGEEEADVRDQAPTTPRQAVARYLEAGLGGDSDRVDDALCNDASPEVSESELAALRSEYEEQPEIEVSTSEPVVSAAGMEVAAQVLFIGDSIFYEDFTVTVLANGDSYCVSEVTQPREDGPAGPPGDIDLDILRFVVWDRDVDSAVAVQCPEYAGPTPEELLAAVEAWESEHGDGGTSYAAPAGDEAQVTPDSIAEFPYEIVLSGDGFDETFLFNVTVSGECVLEVSGGEGLFAYTQD